MSYLIDSIIDFIEDMSDSDRENIFIAIPQLRNAFPLSEIDAQNMLLYYGDYIRQINKMV